MGARISSAEQTQSVLLLTDILKFKREAFVEKLKRTRNLTDDTNREIHGGKTVNRITDIRISSTWNESSEQNGLETFFEAALGSDNAKDAAIIAAQHLISIESVERREKEGFVVLFLNSSFVRVDYLIYTHRATKDVAGVCYVADIGVLPLSKLTMSEIEYLLHQSFKSTSDRENEIIQKLKVQLLIKKVQYEILEESKTPEDFENDVDSLTQTTLEIHKLIASLSTYKNRNIDTDSTPIVRGSHPNGVHTDTVSSNNNENTTPDTESQQTLPSDNNNNNNNNIGRPPLSSWDLPNVVSDSDSNEDDVDSVSNHNNDFEEEPILGGGNGDNENNTPDAGPQQALPSDNNNNNNGRPQLPRNETVIDLNAVSESDSNEEHSDSVSNLNNDSEEEPILGGGNGDNENNTPDAGPQQPLPSDNNNNNNGRPQLPRNETVIDLNAVSESDSNEEHSDSVSNLNNDSEEEPIRGGGNGDNENNTPDAGPQQTLPSDNDNNNNNNNDNGRPQLSRDDSDIYLGSRPEEAERRRPRRNSYPDLRSHWFHN